MPQPRGSQISIPSRHPAEYNPAALRGAPEPWPVCFYFYYRLYITAIVPITVLSALGNFDPSFKLYVINLRLYSSLLDKVYLVISEGLTA